MHHIKTVFGNIICTYVYSFLCLDFEVDKGQELQQCSMFAQNVCCKNLGTSVKISPP